jgi:hypothetical protein
MKVRVALLAITTALALGSGANAAVVNATGSGPGFLSNPFGDPEATFEGQTVSASPQAVPFNSGGATFTGSAIVQAPPTQPGLYAAPFGDPSQYLSVQGGSQVDVSFGGGTFTRLGLYWGSIDTYNSIQFVRNGNVIDTVLGAQAAGAAVDPGSANGNQSDTSTNKFIVITFIGDLGGFDSIRLISSSNSFELDNLSWGGPGQGPGEVPVPLALPLFAAGLGVVGLMSRRRRKMAA